MSKADAQLLSSDLTAQAALLASGALSSRELVQQQLLAIAASQPVINSYLQVDAEAALAAAAESDRHMALIMGERDRRLISEIHEALARVKDGEYGICQECGEEIGLARLRVQPTATLCVHCKSLLEDMGRPYMQGSRAESAFLEE